MSQPNGPHAPTAAPVDLVAILSAIQDQLDDLTAAVKAQQAAIDQLRASVVAGQATR